VETRRVLVHLALVGDDDRALPHAAAERLAKRRAKAASPG
jgi:hypothetical protein